MENKEEFEKDLKEVIKIIASWMYLEIKGSEDEEPEWWRELLSDYAFILNSQGQEDIVRNIGGFYMDWMGGQGKILEFLDKWDNGIK